MAVRQLVVSYLPARVRLLMRAKHYELNDYLAAGFRRGWIHGRRGRVREPRGADLVRLAEWLEAPIEYLYGAASEYDDMAPWEVASRTSLEFYLARDDEGRRLRHLRGDFEAHLGAYAGEAAPRTVAQWSGIAGAMARGRARERTESRDLEQAAGAEPPRV